MYIHVIRPILGLIIVALITACATTDTTNPGGKDLTKIAQHLQKAQDERVTKLCAKGGEKWRMKSQSGSIVVKCDPNNFETIDQGLNPVSWKIYAENNDEVMEISNCGDVNHWPGKRQYMVVDGICTGFLVRDYAPDIQEFILTTYKEQQYTRNRNKGVPVMDERDYRRIPSEHSGDIRYAVTILVEQGWTLYEFAEAISCKDKERLLYYNKEYYVHLGKVFNPTHVIAGEDRFVTCWGLNL